MTRLDILDLLNSDVDDIALAASRTPQKLVAVTLGAAAELLDATRATTGFDERLRKFKLIRFVQAVLSGVRAPIPVTAAKHIQTAIEHILSRDASLPDIHRAAKDAQLVLRGTKTISSRTAGTKVPKKKIIKSPSGEGLGRARRKSLQATESHVRLAVSAALDKKATDPDILAVGGLTSLADYFVVCSAGNERQAQAIADHVVERLREEMQVRPLLIEGTPPARWILVDFGDFIVHIFTEEARRFYGLERLWGDAPNVTAEFTGSDVRVQGSTRKQAG